MSVKKMQALVEDLSPKVPEEVLRLATKLYELTREAHAMGYSIEELAALVVEEYEDCF